MRTAAWLGVLMAVLGAAAPEVSARQKPDEQPIQLDVNIEEATGRGPEEELAEIQRRIDRGDLPKIQFDFDSAAVKPKSYPSLELIAELLLRNPRYKLMVIAHTDSLGSEAYNRKLSEKRAMAVKDYLVKRGVPPPTIRWRGKGPSEPAADNSTEVGREKNRRVEFRIIKRWWSSVY